MAMEEGVRSLAALLFLRLVLAAAASAGGDDAAAAEEKQCHPLASEPYMLVAFHNKDGEEVRLLADQRNKQASGVSAFANQSGHWLYAGIGRKEGKRRRRLFPLPQPNNNRSRGGSRTAEGFWNTLGVLVNSTAASDGDSDPAAAADDDECYMLVGMQTSGGDKIRLVVVADQRYFSLIGTARGFLIQPRCRWSFHRKFESHPLLPLGNGSSHGGSSSSRHAEVVASNLLVALIKGGSGQCGASQSISVSRE